MILLITPEEFGTYRKISVKRDDDKINESIGQAQQSDLISVLGDFYFDVLENSADPAWQNLMLGSSFTYEDEKFEHAGIKSLLADYTMSRHLMKVNKTFTPFGYQQKNSQDSEAVNYNAIKDDAKQAQIDGGFKFIYIEKYIMSEPELFSRYCKNKKTDTSFNSMKIYRI
jgi:hypothetical protein